MTPKGAAVLDTKIRPESETERRSPPTEPPAPKWRRWSLPRDVILGVLSGFVVALGFGGPILSALTVFWTNAVLPAFYTLAQAGLALCG